MAASAIRMGRLDCHGPALHRALSRINATISLDGEQRLYSGYFFGGYMDCSDAKSVPVSISIK
jgi:hypothetical protein